MPSPHLINSELSLNTWISKLWELKYALGSEIRYIIWNLFMLIQTWIPNSLISYISIIYLAIKSWRIKLMNWKYKSSFTTINLLVIWYLNLNWLYSRYYFGLHRTTLSQRKCLQNRIYAFYSIIAWFVCEGKQSIDEVIIINEFTSAAYLILNRCPQDVFFSYNSQPTFSLHTYETQ